MYNTTTTLSLLFLHLLFFTCLYSSNSKPSLKNISSYLVYYDNKEAPENFSRYDLVVLDISYPTPFQYLVDEDTLVLAYMNFGEISQHRDYFKKLKSQGFFLEENPFWPGSFYVDLRNPLWKSFLIETLIPTILHKGYNGLFLDTLDNASFLENKDPKAHKGMTKAAIDLVKTLRYHYPQILIMVNRGYDLFPDIAKDVDMLLAESLYSDYNFETKSNFRVSEKDYLQQVASLKKLQKDYPHLSIFSLDYWDPQDSKTVGEIYQIQRNNGFIPYVADILLDKICKEPLISSTKK